ncbi:MAG: Stk1 family PASTA domain-containing Ser/Thr kinase [Lachnospiraceae bacterium]|nr:Stk1 family PASTA domain-containing Ser/Thr kinase [Lachnospiraceae bacterium]
MDSIKPGMFINDRYEIIDKVGSGGMANVYKAKCHRLNRYVAIKVLKSELASDTNFIKKFRAEAQSVAGLSHPNIVSVYDVGDDDGLHYIVMELVEGITLKRFIERKQRLEVKDAVGIAIQICQGMEAAHNHHIIHRDIKPQNIIISRDGKVKVADFGIAKAATSFTLTEHNEAGSVHYLSPEQARGGYSDERSDIYSLGVTMYEMLTGQVPFSGDNNVSVVLLHLQSEATPVTVLNPSVPHSVDMIVQKCMQKKPERRYQNVAELIADLRRSMTDPDGDYVTISQSANVVTSDTRGITPEEIRELNNSSAQGNMVHYSRKNPQAPVRDYPVRERSGRNDELDQIGNPLIERIVTIVSIIAAIGLILLIFYLVKNSSWFGMNESDPEQEMIVDTDDKINDGDKDVSPTESLIIKRSDPTPTPTPIPDDAPENMVMMGKIDGETLDDAISYLKLVSPDFHIQYSEEYSDEVEKGIVFDQDIPAGTSVNKYSVITFKVSSGGEEFELEDVTGKGKNAAIKLLKGYKLNATILEEYSDEIPEGDVVRTEPEAGSFVSKDTEIMVYVSLGPEIKTVSVPSLLGYTKKEAKKVLEDSFLILGNASEDYSDAYGKGLICAQSISAGETVGKDTVINYTVSLGSMPVSEPEPEPETVGDDETVAPVG